MKSFIKKLRRQRGKTAPLPASGSIETIPFTSKQTRKILSRETRYEPAQLITGCAQSTGKQRDHNEDSLFIFTTVLGGSRNLPLGLFIVADGMGGHQHGEIASSVAARAIAGFLLRKLHPFISNPSETLSESLQEITRNAINEAQQAVMQTAPGSGTTLTAALVLGQQVTIAHVGDSRVYAVRPDGQMELLTRDHTLVKRLEELGQLTTEQAALHPQRNVLYRAIGQSEFLEPDIFTAPFPQPGFLLLCSDGLWGVVSEKEMSRCILESPTLPRASQKLVEAANAAGGPDNITAILVQLLG